MVQNEEYIVYRETGLMRAMHGITVTPAPGGTTLDWKFWVRCPRLLKPLAAALVVWERRRARRCIEALGAL